MIVWRIVRERYRDSVWEGSGGLFASGRWHDKGVRVVYAAEHPAVCAMEVLVHLDPAIIPADLVPCSAEVPDDAVAAIAGDDLPAEWAEWPPGAATRRLGMRWLAEVRGLGLRVPSAAAPRSANILLTPRHPDAHRIRPLDEEPWVVDARLFGRLR